MLVHMRRDSLVQVTNGTDEVICGVPIPPGGQLQAVRGQMSVKDTTRELEKDMMFYSVHGYVLPVLDPDAAATFESIWDTLVPKDETEAPAALDFDTGTADDTPIDEPGDPNLNAVLGMDATDNVQIFKREKFLDIASHPVGLHLDTSQYWWPMDHFNVNIKRKVSVEQPAVCLFGISSPVAATTSATAPVAPTTKEWAMMMFLESTLEDMMKSIVGLTEAGATTPYVDASTFLAELLEPSLYEQTARAADFLDAIWDCNSHLNFQVNMPGSRSFSNLTAG